MIAEQVPSTASEMLLRLAARLEPDELDDLKYRLSLEATATLENDFDISDVPATKARFFELLRTLAEIQPFRERVPEYGMAYCGRPPFMTDILLKDLQDEAARFRRDARVNYDQYIARVETPGDATVCERLAASEELLGFVTERAGPCLPSYVTSYIYYDVPGLCSKPHIDNRFTALTVMVGLRCDRTSATSTASIMYWPDRSRFEYRLAPGEIAIFFGISALHGRTPVVEGETVHSLLLSFRPKMDGGDTS